MLEATRSQWRELSTGVKLRGDWKHLHSDSFTGFLWCTREDLPGTSCSSPIWRWQENKQVVTMKRSCQFFTKSSDTEVWRGSCKCCEESALQRDDKILKLSVLRFSSSLMNLYNHNWSIKPWCQNWPKQTNGWCNPSFSTSLHIFISFISIYSSGTFVHGWNGLNM